MYEELWELEPVYCTTATSEDTPVLIKGASSIRSEQFLVLKRQDAILNFYNIIGNKIH